MRMRFQSCFLSKEVLLESQHSEFEPGTSDFRRLSHYQLTWDLTLPNHVVNCTRGIVIPSLVFSPFLLHERGLSEFLVVLNQLFGNGVSQRNLHNVSGT